MHQQLAQCRIGSCVFVLAVAICFVFMFACADVRMSVIPATFCSANSSYYARYARKWYECANQTDALIVQVTVDPSTGIACLLQVLCMCESAKDAANAHIHARHHVADVAPHDTIRRGLNTGSRT